MSGISGFGYKDARLRRVQTSIQPVQAGPNKHLGGFGQSNQLTSMLFSMIQAMSQLGGGFSNFAGGPPQGAAPVQGGGYGGGGFGGGYGGGHQNFGGFQPAPAFQGPRFTPPPAPIAKAPAAPKKAGGYS